jgi:hypothetical protein
VIRPWVPAPHGSWPFRNAEAERLRGWALELRQTNRLASFQIRNARLERALKPATHHSNTVRRILQAVPNVAKVRGALSSTGS